MTRIAFIFLLLICIWNNNIIAQTPLINALNNSLIKRDPVINVFLTKKTYSKNIGSTYTKSNKEIKPGYMLLIDKFDGVAFFRSTSALLPPFTWDKKE